MLLYTFSSYNDGRSILEHLHEQLIKAGFDLKPRTNEEIMEKLIASEENRYIRKLVTLIVRFISNFKVNGYTTDDFDRMYHSFVIDSRNVKLGFYIDGSNYLASQSSNVPYDQL